jgi:hypothetical protein
VVRACLAGLSIFSRIVSERDRAELLPGGDAIRMQALPTVSRSAH